MVLLRILIFIFVVLLVILRSSCVVCVVRILCILMIGWKIFVWLCSCLMVRLSSIVGISVMLIGRGGLCRFVLLLVCYVNLMVRCIDWWVLLRILWIS